MIGADNILFALGLELGTDANVLTNLAAHNHSSDGTSTPEVPLAGALPLFASGLGALWLVAWRRKKKAALAEASVAGSAKYEAIDL